MEKHFVDYNQALALKGLGFNKPCMGKYDTKQGDEWLINIYSGHLNTQFGDKNNACIAPLRSQVFEWGRKEYGLYHVVHHFEHKKDTPEEFLAEVSGKLLMLNDEILGFSYHSTYEETESACIDKLIEIIKNK